MATPEEKTLHHLAEVMNKAAVLVAKGQWKQADDLLASASETLQKVRHPIWLHHHKSGTL